MKIVRFIRRYPFSIAILVLAAGYVGFRLWVEFSDPIHEKNYRLIEHHWNAKQVTALLGTSDRTWTPEQQVSLYSGDANGAIEFFDGLSRKKSCTRTRDVIYGTDPIQVRNVCTWEAKHVTIHVIFDEDDKAVGKMMEYDRSDSHWAKLLRWLTGT